MSCCDRCPSFIAWSFVLDGDGDGIEFLTQHSWTTTGLEEVTTVIYR